MIEARFYDSDGSDRPVALADLAACRPDDRQLLWIDLQAPDADEIAQVSAALRLPGDVLEQDRRRSPAIRVSGRHFRVDAVPVTSTRGLGFRGTWLAIIAGDNCVVTLHQQPIASLEELREIADGESDVGRLSADSFAASLLDWHLSTYFAATAEFERQVESLEVQILDGNGRESLDELRRLRRAASRLRRMLSPHRVVFGTLSRPDFRPSEGHRAERHYQALDTRFERAMDMVENARELVLGSFELFSGQTALQTNRLMGRLTFVTVVLGVLAVITGMLGMNFDATFFASRDHGFWATASALLVIAMAAVTIGRWRGWV
jgi:magnesium transporter